MPEQSASKMASIAFMRVGAFGRRGVAAATVVALIVVAEGTVLHVGPWPILASALIAVASSLLRPQFAFACFITGGVWKTAAVFGVPDSLLPTAALLVGWSAAVVLRGDVRHRFSAAVRATVLLLPLVLWLFVSTSVSHTAPGGYVESIRFLAVVVLPSLLVALDMRRGRLQTYAGVVFIAATVLSLGALARSAAIGTFWTKELVLFDENSIDFGRVAAIGFVAGMALLPISWRPVAGSSLYVGILVCATAVAHSTSRGAALAAVAGGIGVLVLVATSSGAATRHRRLSSFGLAAALTFLVVSAIAFFPTGRGIQTLTALPSEIEAFVQVPLPSPSVPTAATETVGPSFAATSPTPPLATSSAGPSPIATPDPAAVYQSDLSLAARIERYRIALMQFFASPLIGLGYTHGVLARDGQSYAHNIFLEVASELGLIGLACLGVLLLAVVRAFVQGRSDWELGIGAVLLLCMFVAAQTSGDLTINRLFFVLCVAVLAYADASRDDRSRTVSPALAVA